MSCSLRLSLSYSVNRNLSGNPLQSVDLSSAGTGLTTVYVERSE